MAKTKKAFSQAKHHEDFLKEMRKLIPKLVPYVKIIRKKKVGVMRTASGSGSSIGRKGEFDLILGVDISGLMLWVECEIKTGDGVLNPDQVLYRDYMEGLNVMCFVVSEKTHLRDIRYMRDAFEALASRVAVM